jgi:hypothetical protein
MRTGHDAPFRVPLNIGRVPVLAVLGVITSAFLVLQFSLLIYFCEAAVIISGAAAYFLIGRRNGHRHPGHT